MARPTKPKTASRIYFPHVVSTASGDAFLAGHVRDQGHEPTFTRFVRAGDGGFAHLGDLGAVVYAAAPVPITNAPRPGVAVIGRDGPLRLYRPGQAPIDLDVPRRDRTATFESVCAASDGLYVCGGQRQVLRYDGSAFHPVDDGLFVPFDGTNDVSLFGIAEISPGRVLVVGTGGFVACRAEDGSWTTVDAGTRVDLRCVLAAGDGGAWVAGDGGTLLRLEADMVTVSSHSAPETSRRSFESLALLDGALYVTAVDALLVLRPGARLEAVLGPFVDGSEFHAVSAAGEYLWVTGDEHAYRLGPAGWRYFLCPDNEPEARRAR